VTLLTCEGASKGDMHVEFFSKRKLLESEVEFSLLSTKHCQNCPQLLHKFSAPNSQAVTHCLVINKYTLYTHMLESILQKKNPETIIRFKILS
jgi:hypothetical protein